MLDPFREVVLVDTEFTTIAGERPEPVCLVAHELRSGRRLRIFEGQFGSSPPYATGPDVLFVAFYASAELGVYRVLGWSRPERVLDLFVEFRNHTNGLPTPAGFEPTRRVGVLRLGRHGRHREARDAGGNR
jgi:DNA polymerase I